MKPIKEKPYRDSDVLFEKTLPINRFNFPLTKFTDWKIYGYKKDPLTGIKRPYWLTKRIATGRPITPQLCGLDGFYDVKALNQVM